MILKSFPKFHVRHEGFASYGLRKSDEGAVTDLIYNCCKPSKVLTMVDYIKIFSSFIGLLFSYPSLYIIVMLSRFSFLSH